MIVDIANGSIDGYRDVRQAAEHMGYTAAKTRGILKDGGVRVVGTQMLGTLNLVKSKRGGKR